MNAFRHFLPVFTLFLAVFAPQAAAMNLLPKARQVAAMVMQPGVRSALTQAGKAGTQKLTSAVAPQAERRLMTFAQSNVQSASHQISNVAKPIINEARSTLAQKCALGIGGAGLTYAIDNNAVAHATDGTYLSLFAKLWAAMVGTAVVEAITYGEQDFPTVQTFIKMVAQNPEYARELAQKVTQDNIFELNPQLLAEIVRNCPEDKERFAAYLTSNPTQFFKGLHHSYSWAWCMWFRHLCVELVKDNPQTTALFAAFTLEHFEKIVAVESGRDFLEDMIKGNPTLARSLTASVAEHLVILAKNNTSVFGFRVIDEIMKHNPESIPLITESAVKHFAQLAMGGYRGLATIERIIKHNPESMTLFATCLFEHYAAFEKTPNGQYFIHYFKSWIINNQKTAVLCTPVAAENIALLAGSEKGIEFINELMKFDPQAVVLFAESAAKKFDTLVGTSNGRFLIMKLAEANLPNAAILGRCIAQHAESFIDNHDLLSVIAHCDSEWAALIAPVAAKNIEKLIESWQGRRLLGSIVQLSPETAASLTPDVIKNLTALTGDFYGSFIVKTIMEQNPASKALFAQATRDNFVAMVKQDNGYEIIEKIMDYNPESRAEFINLTIENLEPLLSTGEGYNGQYFIARLAQNNRELAVSCIEPVINRFVMLANSVYGRDIIHNIMQHNPAPFIEAGSQNIVALMKNDVGTNCLHRMMDLAPESIPALAAAAVQNIATMLETDNGAAFIKAMIKRDTQASALIVKQAIADCVQLAEKDNGLRLLIYLMTQDSAVKKELQQKFSESSNQGDVSNSLSFVREIFYKTMRSERYEEITPTELGFMYNKDHLKKYMQAELEKDAIKRVVKDVIAIEKEYQKTHYTFVHGRNFAYNLREMVYRNLWEYAHNAKVPADFRFTHTKEEHDPLTKDVLVMPEEKKLHERNITVLENYRSEELRNRRLFLNTQLFGNLHVAGSSSFSYFLRNDNASSLIRVSIEDIFGQFGQKELYEKYKERFEALDQEHRALTKYGELLVVAVPRERVSEDVQTIDVHGEAAGVKTLDAMEIRETDPSFKDNVLNFTLAMTDTAALNPESGIKVRSVHAVNPAKYAAWQEKYDALMGELEAEFKRTWKQSIAAKERGHKELLGVVGEVKKRHAAKHKTTHHSDVNK